MFPGDAGETYPSPAHCGREWRINWNYIRYGYIYGGRRVGLGRDGITCWGMAAAVPDVYAHVEAKILRCMEGTQAGNLQLLAGSRGAGQRVRWRAIQGVRYPAGGGDRLPVCI